MPRKTKWPYQFQLGDTVSFKTLEEIEVTYPTYARYHYPYMGSRLRWRVKNSGNLTYTIVSRAYSYQLKLPYYRIQPVDDSKVDNWYITRRTTVRENWLNLVSRPEPPPPKPKKKPLKKRYKRIASSISRLSKILTQQEEEIGDTTNGNSQGQ